MTSDETIGAYLEQRTGDGEVPPGTTRVRTLLGTPGTWADPPPGLRDRVFAAMERAQRAEPAGVQLAAPALPSPPAEPTGSRMPRRRLLTLAAGIAAFGAGTATGWVALDAARREESGTSIQLAGTDVAPGASAEGTVRRTPDGVAISLHVAGLAAAALGWYYAAWLTAEDRPRVPIGSFHLRGGGDETIELWAGVDPANYPTITVTFESEETGIREPGIVVLRGDVPPG